MNNIIILLILFILFILIIILSKHILQDNIKILENFNPYKSKIKIIKEKKKIITDSKYSLHYNYAKLLSNFYPLEILTSDGTFENIEKINDNKISFGLAQEDMVINAVLGLKPFKKKYNLNYILGIFEEQINLVVNPKFNINSWNDLEGKTICFGSKNSLSLYNGLVLCELIGIKKKNIDIIYGNIYSKNIKDLIINDKIHGFVIISENPNTFIKNLCKIKSLKFLGCKGIGDDLIKIKFPHWIKSNIDMKDYKILSSNNILNTWSIKTVLITNSKEDKRTVFNLIKTLFENNYRIKKSFKNSDQKKVIGNYQLDKSFDRKNIIDLHEGVKLYYKYIGIITENKDEKCKHFVGTGLCNLEVVPGI